MFTVTPNAVEKDRPSGSLFDRVKDRLGFKTRFLSGYSSSVGDADDETDTELPTVPHLSKNSASTPTRKGSFGASWTSDTTPVDGEADHAFDPFLKPTISTASDALKDVTTLPSDPPVFQKRTRAHHQTPLPKGRNDVLNDSSMEEIDESTFKQVSRLQHNPPAAKNNTSASRTYSASHRRKPITPVSNNDNTIDISDSIDPPTSEEHPTSDEASTPSSDDTSISEDESIDTNGSYEEVTQSSDDDSKHNTSATSSSSAEETQKTSAKKPSAKKSSAKTSKRSSGEKSRKKNRTETRPFAKRSSAKTPLPNNRGKKARNKNSKAKKHPFPTRTLSCSKDCMIEMFLRPHTLYMASMIAWQLLFLMGVTIEYFALQRRDRAGCAHGS